MVDLSQDECSPKSGGPLERFQLPYHQHHHRTRGTSSKIMRFSYAVTRETRICAKTYYRLHDFVTKSQLPIILSHSAPVSRRPVAYFAGYHYTPLARRGVEPSLLRRRTESLPSENGY